MGYTTTFTGAFHLNKPLDPALETFFKRFSQTRHVRRDIAVIKAMDPEWKEHCFKGDLGESGAYYLPPATLTKDQIQSGSLFMRLPSGDGPFDNKFGQVLDRSVINNNQPPAEMPGLWCQWLVHGDSIEWDGMEKFYNYVEWLEYILKHFLIPEGYVVNGSVKWQGEEAADTGIITVTNNKVSVKEGKSDPLSLFSDEELLEELKKRNPRLVRYAEALLQKQAD